MWMNEQGQSQPRSTPSVRLNGWVPLSLPLKQCCIVSYCSITRRGPKNMALSYQQAPDYASSQEVTSDLAIARMNSGAPSNTMMTSSTFPAQAGGAGDAQTTTPFMQRSQHDSRGSEGYDPSVQPRSYQEPSYESWSDDEEFRPFSTSDCAVSSLTQLCLVVLKTSMSRSWV